MIIFNGKRVERGLNLQAQHQRLIKEYLGQQNKNFQNKFVFPELDLD